MNQNPFQYMPQFQQPFPQNNIETRLANIENELKIINEKLEKLLKEKSNLYLQKDDNLYML